MPAINFDSIVALAGGTDDSDLPTSTASLPSNIRDALNKRLEIRKAERAERAVDSIVILLDGVDSTIETRVAEIRQMRATITRLKNEMSMLEATRDYGMRTQNFVPLMAALGYRIDHHRELIEMRDPGPSAKTAEPATFEEPTI